MRNLYRLCRYHARAGLPFFGTALVGLYASSILAARFVGNTASPAIRSTTYLEVALPELLGLYAAQLPVVDQDYRISTMIGLRTSPARLLLARLAVAGGAVAAVAVAYAVVLVLETGQLGMISWTLIPLPVAIASALMAILATVLARSRLTGWVLISALWLGFLIFGSYLPGGEPFYSLHPIAFAAGQPLGDVVRSKLFYLALDLILLTVANRFARSGAGNSMRTNRQMDMEVS